MQIVDLTLPLTDQMRGVQITPATRIQTKGYNTSTLNLYSHCGTHMDAPRHFLSDGETLDRQRLEACIGDALVVDLTPIEPRTLITPADLAVEENRITYGTRLLLRTDWYHRHGTDEYRDGLPRISRELAEWLVRRQVTLLGVEQPSVADVNEIGELTEIHQILFRGGVTIIEGLANLDRLTRDTVRLIALPLLIPGGDGSPVRAVALEE